eukprot:TRINITY_DN13244_c0_g1_i1.p1 TRINITY_DN13244_c0_g1~~TRINITY_DN13244_c0_g1_i1.p1  ORF type:complete len:415 (+),score=104.33 TRINITY_DN13244_c0_g1_i1:70-1314(+)
MLPALLPKTSKLPRRGDTAQPPESYTDAARRLRADVNAGLMCDLKSAELRQQLSATAEALLAVDGLNADDASALSDERGDTAEWLTAVAAAAAAQGDFEFALAVLQAASQAGNAVAAMELAAWHWHGAGGASKAVDRSLQWCDQAAAQGHPAAQYFVSTFLEDGVGVPVDKPLAMVWLGRSAEQGYPPACHALGQKYELGHTVEQSHLAAFRWYKHAARNGHAESELSIGKLFLLAGSESGQTKDGEQKARRWLEAAAVQGCTEALQLLQHVQSPHRDRGAPAGGHSAAKAGGGGVAQLLRGRRATSEAAAQEPPPAAPQPTPPRRRPPPAAASPPTDGPAPRQGRGAAPRQRPGATTRSRKAASQPPVQRAAGSSVWDQLHLPAIPAVPATVTGGVGATPAAKWLAAGSRVPS